MCYQEYWLSQGSVQSVRLWFLLRRGLPEKLSILHTLSWRSKGSLLDQIIIYKYEYVHQSLYIPYVSCHNPHHEHDSEEVERISPWAGSMLESAEVCDVEWIVPAALPYQIALYASKRWRWTCFLQSLGILQAVSGLRAQLRSPYPDHSGASDMRFVGRLVFSPTMNSVFRTENDWLPFNEATVRK